MSLPNVVITRAGNHPNLVGHVYVAAFVSETGEILTDAIRRFDPLPAFAHAIQDDQGYIRVDADPFPEIFAGEISRT